MLENADQNNSEYGQFSRSVVNQNFRGYAVLKKAAAPLVSLFYTNFSQN